MISILFFIKMDQHNKNNRKQKVIVQPGNVVVQPPQVDHNLEAVGVKAQAKMKTSARGRVAATKSTIRNGDPAGKKDSVHHDIRLPQIKQIPNRSVSREVVQITGGSTPGAVNKSVVNRTTNVSLMTKGEITSKTNSFKKFLAQGQPSVSPMNQTAAAEQFDTVAAGVSSKNRASPHQNLPSRQAKATNAAMKTPEASEKTSKAMPDYSAGKRASGSYWFTKLQNTEAISSHKQTEPIISQTSMGMPLQQTMDYRYSSIDESQRGTGRFAPTLESTPNTNIFASLLTKKPRIEIKMNSNSRNDVPQVQTDKINASSNMDPERITHRQTAEFAQHSNLLTKQRSQTNTNKKIIKKALFGVKGKQLGKVGTEAAPSRDLSVVNLKQQLTMSVQDVYKNLPAERVQSELARYNTKLDSQTDRRDKLQFGGDLIAYSSLPQLQHKQMLNSGHPSLPDIMNPASLTNPFDSLKMTPPESEREAPELYLSKHIDSSKPMSQVPQEDTPSHLVQEHLNCQLDNLQRLQEVQNLEQLIGFKIRTVTDHMHQMSDVESSQPQRNDNLTASQQAALDTVHQLESQYEQNQMMLLAMRRLFDPLLRTQIDLPGALVSATGSNVALSNLKKKRTSKITSGSRTLLGRNSSGSLTRLLEPSTIEMSQVPHDASVQQLDTDMGLDDDMADDNVFDYIREHYARLHREKSTKRVKPAHKHISQPHSRMASLPSDHNASQNTVSVQSASKHASGSKLAAYNSTIELKEALNQLNRNVLQSNILLQQYDQVCTAVNEEVEKRLVREELERYAGFQEPQRGLTMNVKNYHNLNLDGKVNPTKVTHLSAFAKPQRIGATTTMQGLDRGQPTSKSALAAAASAHQIVKNARRLAEATSQSQLVLKDAPLDFRPFPLESERKLQQNKTEKRIKKKTLDPAAPGLSISPKASAAKPSLRNPRKLSRKFIKDQLREASQEIIEEEIKVTQNSVLEVLGRRKVPHRSQMTSIQTKKQVELKGKQNSPPGIVEPASSVAAPADEADEDITVAGATEGFNSLGKSPATIPTTNFGDTARSKVMMKQGAGPVIAAAAQTTHTIDHSSLQSRMDFPRGTNGTLMKEHSTPPAGEFQQMLEDEISERPGARGKAPDSRSGLIEGFEHSQMGQTALYEDVTRDAASASIPDMKGHTPSAAHKSSGSGFSQLKPTLLATRGLSLLKKSLDSGSVYIEKRAAATNTDLTSIDKKRKKASVSKKQPKNTLPAGEDTPHLNTRNASSTLAIPKDGQTDGTIIPNSLQSMLNDDEISPSLSIMQAKKQSIRSPLIVAQQQDTLLKNSYAEDPFGPVNDQTFMPEEETQILTKSELQSLQQTTKAQINMQVKVLELNGLANVQEHPAQQASQAHVQPSRSRQTRGTTMPEAIHKTSMLAQGTAKVLSPREAKDSSADPTGFIDSQRTTQLAPKSSEIASTYLRHYSFLENNLSKRGNDLIDMRQIVSSRLEAQMETSKSADDLSLALAAGEERLGRIVELSKLDSNSDAMMATHTTMNLNQDLDILGGLKSTSHVKEPPKVESSQRVSPSSLAQNDSKNFLVQSTKAQPEQVFEQFLQRHMLRRSQWVPERFKRVPRLHQASQKAQQQRFMLGQDKTKRFISLDNSMISQLAAEAPALLIQNAPELAIDPSVRALEPDAQIRALQSLARKAGEARRHAEASIFILETSPSRVTKRQANMLRQDLVEQMQHQRRMSQLSDSQRDFTPDMLQPVGFREWVQTVQHDSNTRLMNISEKHNDDTQATLVAKVVRPPSGTIVMQSQGNSQQASLYVSDEHSREDFIGIEENHTAVKPSGASSVKREEPSPLPMVPSNGELFIQIQQSYRKEDEPEAAMSTQGSQVQQRSGQHAPSVDGEEFIPSGSLQNTVTQSPNIPPGSASNAQLQARQRLTMGHIYDPFRAVQIGKRQNIDNQILTSYRTLLRQNNVISKTLKVLHKRYMPSRAPVPMQGKTKLHPVSQQQTEKTERQLAEQPSSFSIVPKPSIIHEEAIEDEIIASSAARTGKFFDGESERGTELNRKVSPRRVKIEKHQKAKPYHKVQTIPVAVLDMSAGQHGEEYGYGYLREKYLRDSTNQWNEYVARSNNNRIMIGGKIKKCQQAVALSSTSLADRNIVTLSEHQRTGGIGSSKQLSVKSIDPNASIDFEEAHDSLASGRQKTNQSFLKELMKTEKVQIGQASARQNKGIILGGQSINESAVETDVRTRKKNALKMTEIKSPPVPQVGSKTETGKISSANTSNKQHATMLVKRNSSNGGPQPDIVVMNLRPDSPRHVTDQSHIESLERDASLLHGLDSVPSKKVVALSRSYFEQTRQTPEESSQAEASRDAHGPGVLLSARQSANKKRRGGGMSNRRGSNEDLSIHEGIIQSARFEVSALIGEEPQIAATSLGTTQNQTVHITAGGSTMHQTQWPVGPNKDLQVKPA